MTSPENKSLTEPLQITKIRDLFEFYQENSADVRLVGSWARAAVFDTPLPPVTGSYGGYRDIDATILQTPEPKRLNILQESKLLCHPVVFEEHFSSHIRNGGNVWTINYKGLHYEVNPDIFEKKSVNLFDFVIHSFDPKTLLYLTYLYGPTRPQDSAVRNYFHPIADQISSLPDSLFAPFRQLDYDRKVNYPREEQLAALRRHYHSMIPLSVRKTLGIITVPLWNKITGQK